MKTNFNNFKDQNLKEKETKFNSENEGERDLTSGLMQILRTNWNPQIPTAAPTAANSGYT